MKIEDVLKHLISEKTGVAEDKVFPNSHFEEDLNVSKIELAGFLLFLEDYFSINLRGDDIKNLRTVDDLRVVIEDQLDEL